MDIYDGLLEAIEREYTTLRRLKSSGWSRVDIVRHGVSGTRYIFRRFTGSGEVYARLLGVSSPHLPEIYEMGSRDGHVAVLEEYIQGDTLAFLLRADVLTPRQARDVTAQLCAALWTLHSMGVVHRDVKPENVVMRGSEAVLIDFNASRIFKPDTEGDTQVLGTTGYAAPEQYGISQSDFRADIYSLGVLLNVMLAGKHPSKCMAPGRLGRVVQKCTMTSPEKRYKSALQLLEAL